jgi:hypothetical protein
MKIKIYKVTLKRGTQTEGGLKIGCYVEFWTEGG